jgi:hypothetical protein
MSDDPIDASPFYAVIESGRLECPMCGRMLVYGKGRGGRGWSEIAALLRCTGCGQRFQLGTIAWPVPLGRPVEGFPAGQRANLRQLSELRQLTGGFWRRKPREKEQGTNVYVAEGCSCAPKPWRAECPVHGQLQIRAAADEREP